MRCARALLLAVVALAVLAGSSTAQSTLFWQSLDTAGGLPAFLANPSVQRELAINGAQAQRALVAMNRAATKRRDDFAKLQNVKPADRDQKAKEMMKAYADDHWKALAKVLRPAQIQRLKEIGVQAAGVDAFADDEIRQRLKLTDDQADKLEKIRQTFREQRTAALKESAGKNVEDRLQMLKVLREEMVKRAMECLTEDQVMTYRTMTGKTFDFKPGQGGGLRPAGQP